MITARQIIARSTPSARIRHSRNEGRRLAASPSTTGRWQALRPRAEGLVSVHEMCPVLIDRALFCPERPDDQPSLLWISPAFASSRGRPLSGIQHLRCRRTLVPESLDFLLAQMLDADKAVLCSTGDLVGGLPEYLAQFHVNGFR
jgi:hypothetical protein